MVDYAGRGIDHLAQSDRALPRLALEVAGGVTRAHEHRVAAARQLALEAQAPLGRALGLQEQGPGAAARPAELAAGGDEAALLAGLARDRHLHACHAARSAAGIARAAVQGELALPRRLPRLFAHARTAPAGRRP